MTGTIDEVTSSDSVCLHRDGRVLVVRDGATVINKMNHNIESINTIARDTNVSATPAPLVTDLISVYDLDCEAFHYILVFKVDYRPITAQTIGDVVVFTKPKYAPERSDDIQLGTPRYYRDREDLDPGIQDPHDGTLTLNSTQWARSIVGGTVQAQVTFSSESEPWVYCGAHYRTIGEIRRLRKLFAQEHQYSIATQIHDPSAIAIWLGIEFALCFNKSKHVALNQVDRNVYKRSSYSTNLWEGTRPIDTVIRVYHGPVHYEDFSGKVDRQDHFFDPTAGPKAWFTKKLEFKEQSEYRYAISTIGTPVKQQHWIPLTPELRSFFSEL